MKNGNNNRRKAGNSRNNKAPAKQQKQQKRSSKQATTSTMKTYALPVSNGYQIRNTVPDSRCIERGHELLSSITLASNTATDTYFEFQMNPASVSFTKTRLQSMSRVYQKYRFKKMSMTIGNVTGTNVGGSLVVGYTENPDFNVGRNPSQTMVAQNGSITAAIWQPIICTASIKDKTKWYNIDQDSSELMQICQGKFVVVVQFAPSVATPVQLPIYFDYEIEFIGSAIQTFVTTGNKYLMPECTVRVTSPGNNQFILDLADPSVNFPSLEIGGSLPPAVNTYLIEPAYEILDVAGIARTARYAVCTFQENPQTYSEFVFFETLDDVRDFKVIPFSVKPSQTLPRTSIIEYF